MWATVLDLEGGEHVGQSRQLGRVAPESRGSIGGEVGQAIVPVRANLACDHGCVECRVRSGKGVAAQDVGEVAPRCDGVVGIEHCVIHTAFEIAVDGEGLGLDRDPGQVDVRHEFECFSGVDVDGRNLDRRALRAEAGCFQVYDDEVAGHQVSSTWWGWWA
ncbi:Uncharacterised protein [Mycobacteroides abscessus]|nr:Uncharacterised protein [Mycobacteroides abscessus]